MAISLFHRDFSRPNSRDPELALLALHDPDGAAGAPPIAWVFVRTKISSTCQTPGLVYIESIELTYEFVDAHGDPSSAGGSFCGSYDQSSNQVSLTSSSATGRGGVYMHQMHRSLRLGTYLFDVIVGWAQQWKGATVNSIWLADGDGYTENRDRRNRFYEQFGLVFDYDDATKRSGRSRVMPIENLVRSDGWNKTILPMSPTKGIQAMMRRQYQLMSDIEAKTRALSGLEDRLAWRDNHIPSIAWGWFYGNCGHYIWLTVLVFLLVFAAWRQWH